MEKLSEWFRRSRTNPRPAFVRFVLDAKPPEREKLSREAPTRSFEAS
jgi:hypothetical protein